MCDETFGPVAAITPFDTEDGGGAPRQRHRVRPHRLSAQPRPAPHLPHDAALQFGMVAVNRTKVTGAPIPFGGVKQSGLGREGARRGMEEFMEIKYVCRDWA